MLLHGVRMDDNPWDTVVENLRDLHRHLVSKLPVGGRSGQCPTTQTCSS